MDENGAVTEIITLTKKKIKIKKHNMFVIWQGEKLRFSPCLFWRKNMRRKIVALIEVDDDTGAMRS